MRVTIGGAADSWGIWFPRPKRQNPYEIANARIGVCEGSGRALASKTYAV